MGPLCEDLCVSVVLTISQKVFISYIEQAIEVELLCKVIVALWSVTCDALYVWTKQLATCCRRFANFFHSSDSVDSVSL